MDIARITPHIKLSLQARGEEDSAVFGSGVAQLCRGVEQWGSLNKAAKEMSMAYSKAWRIMKHTEASFGIQILERNGAHGSALTAEGALLLHTYDELQKRIISYAEKQLDEILENESLPNQTAASLD